MDRRTFLGRGVTLGLGAAAATGLGWVGPWAALARAQARTAGTVVDPTGTTLAATLLPSGDGPYRRFVVGPGAPIVLREDLAGAHANREGRRQALATIVHLTDIHLIDGQSPTRVEFLDRYDDPATVNPNFFSSAWRPQEMLGAHIADAMARTLRAVGDGPVTGRGFDCAVTTGDSTDNQQLNELEWFLAIADGGRPVSFNSGDPDRYEGIQDEDPLSFDPAYYHPGGGDRVDRYRENLGYPDRPEMLAAAIAPFTPVGLPCPWYSVYGNHDGLLQGNMPTNEVFDAIAAGPLKVVGLPDGLSQAALEQIVAEQDLLRLLASPFAPSRLVTPDAQRMSATPRDWVLAHLEDHGGPGPIGHGMAPEAADTGQLYYSFELAPSVLGISLDTVNRGGYANGSLDAPQFAWLEQQLIAASSRYFDASGHEVTTSNDDHHIVVFSHHTSATMDNPIVDPTTSPAPRVLGGEVVALLNRFPNVVAWIVGHTHENRIFAHPDPDSGGFWEITTAAHIDHPQQGRIVELVDNRDGTLSLFTTLIDHAGPAVPPDEVRTVLDLASLARELGVNDVQKAEKGVGTPGDQNTELVLTAAFSRATAPPDPRPGRPAPPVDAGPPDDRPPPRPRPAAVEAAVTRLPATGAGATAAAGAALLAGAAALSRRGGSEDA